MLASMLVTPSVASISEQRNVGGFEVLAGHDDGQLFGHHLGLALAPDAGGIDEAEEVALALDDLVDGVARGAGDVRNDGAVGAGQGVQQGGLADVGAADDGDLGLARLILAVRALLAAGLLLVLSPSSSGSNSSSKPPLRLRRWLSSALRGGSGRTANTSSSRSPMPEPCSAEIMRTLRKPRRRKFSAAVCISRRVDLVDGEEDGFAAAHEQARQLHVGRSPARCGRRRP